MSDKKQFFVALTGFRAIVAWMIFIYHFMPFNNPKYPTVIKQSIFNFHIGVEMFFVLSGFLILYRYFNDNPMHFKRYMVNRFARIYPMYFLITIGAFSVWFLQNNSWNIEKTIELTLSVTMTKALFSKYNLAGVAQGWTLTLEEIFYIMAPLYFILIRKSRWSLVLLPIFIFIAGTVLKRIADIPENQWGFLQKNIAVYISDFFVGMALGYIVLNNKKSFSRPFASWFGLAIILIYVFFKHYLEHLFDFKSDIGRFSEITFLAIFGIAPLIWGLIYEKTILQTILSKPIFVLLGKSSYIFYLIHKGFIPVFINDYIIDNKFVIFILLNLISLVLFLCIEEPLNHAIRKRFSKKRTTLIQI